MMTDSDNSQARFTSDAMQKVTDRLSYEIKLAYAMLSEINDAVCNADTIDDLAVLGLKAHSMKKLWTQYTASFLVELGVYDSVRHLLLTIDEVIETIIEPKVDKLRVPTNDNPELRISIHTDEPFRWMAFTSEGDDDRNCVIGSTSNDDTTTIINEAYRIACNVMQDRVTPIHLEVFVPSQIYVFHFERN